MYLLGVAIYVILNNAFYGINVFIRIYTLFEYFTLYLIPFIINSGKTYNDKRMIKLAFVVYYIALTSYAIFYKNGNGVIPYDTFLNWA